MGTSSNIHLRNHKMQKSKFLGELCRSCESCGLVNIPMDGVGTRSVVCWNYSTRYWGNIEPLYLGQSNVSGLITLWEQNERQEGSSRTSVRKEKRVKSMDPWYLCFGVSKPRSLLGGHPSYELRDNTWNVDAGRGRPIRCVMFACLFTISVCKFGF